MERVQSSLFEAAAKGCTNSLQQLLIYDPLILERDLVNCFNETPLHVAATLGHVDFVKKIIEINPQLVYELNLQKRCPLHLAAVKGHVDVVKALLSVAQLTCLARDSKGLTPLHLAAVKGRDEAVKLLLEAQHDAARILLYEGKETILHLCVKSHQLEALKLVLTTINNDDPEFINSKDANGNTALDLAVAENQLQTVRFMMSVGAVEMNAMNDEGKTTLNVLIGNRRDLRDSEIEKSLTNAGGTQKAAEMKTKGSRKTSTKKDNHHSDWMENKKNSLMVVASLVATMAFQIGVNPPGGLWQEDGLQDDKDGNPHLAVAGTPVYLHKNPQGYKDFYIVNTTAFVTSLSTILFLTSGLPVRRKIYVLILTVIMWVPIIAIATCYVLAIIMVIPEKTEDSVVNVILDSFLVWVVLIALLCITHIFRFIMMLLRNMGKAWSRWRRSPPTSTGLGLVAP